MDVKEVLEILDDLGGLELIESLIYKEIMLTQELGNPTTTRYKKLRELYDLISDFHRNERR